MMAVAATAPDIGVHVEELASRETPTDLFGIESERKLIAYKSTVREHLGVKSHRDALLREYTTVLGILERINPPAALSAPELSPNVSFALFIVLSETFPEMPRDLFLLLLRGKLTLLGDMRTQLSRLALSDPRKDLIMMFLMGFTEDEKKQYALKSARNDLARPLVEIISVIVQRTAFDNDSVAQSIASCNGFLKSYAVTLHDEITDAISLRERIAPLQWSGGGNYTVAIRPFSFSLHDPFMRQFMQLAPEVVQNRLRSILAETVSATDLSAHLPTTADELIAFMRHILPREALPVSDSSAVEDALKYRLMALFLEAASTIKLAEIRGCFNAGVMVPADDITLRRTLSILHQDAVVRYREAKRKQIASIILCLCQILRHHPVTTMSISIAFAALITELAVAIPRTRPSPADAQVDLALQIIYSSAVALPIALRGVSRTNRDFVRDLGRMPQLCSRRLALRFMGAVAPFVLGLNMKLELGPFAKARAIATYNNATTTQSTENLVAISGLFICDYLSPPLIAAGGVLLLSLIVGLMLRCCNARYGLFTQFRGPDSLSGGGGGPRMFELPGAASPSPRRARSETHSSGGDLRVEGASEIGLALSPRRRTPGDIRYYVPLTTPTHSHMSAPVDTAGVAVNLNSRWN